jgi:4-hydroxybenzoate polyprenyltransferase
MKAYISISRFDHYFKNLFMLIGFIAVVTYNHETPTLSDFKIFAFGFFLTCLMASCNYVINEILDAPFDLQHPVKKNRPVPSGQVRIPLAWSLALFYGLVSLALSFLFMPLAFTFSLLLFSLSGLLYNIRPFRLKDRPFLDVICESANNPIRLLLGWFCLREMADPLKEVYQSIYLNGFLLPPVSVLLGYWAIGGFMMTAKRFAELRSFDSPEQASNYRICFKAYTEARLATAMASYISFFAFSFGIMAIKYQKTLVFYVPFLVIFIAWFYHLMYEEDSFVKTPEKLIEKPLFLAYCIFLLVLLVFLLYWGLNPSL